MAPVPAVRRLLSALVAAGLLLTCVAPGAGARRPNVLLIAVDDLRPWLSCLGAEGVRTPHIDRLAARGTAFARHYAAVPTCGASRYALLTGRHPIRSGVTGGNDVFHAGASALADDGAVGVRSLPEHLRRAGWRTVGLGKVSHTPDGRVFAYDGSGDGRPELPDAWDALPQAHGPWGRGWGAFFAYPDGHHREDGHGHVPLGDFSAVADEDLPDGLLARAAVRQLEQLAVDERPFLLAVGFYKPHLPFVAPAADRAAVDDWDLSPPAHPERPDSAHTSGSGEFFRYTADHGRGPLSADQALDARRAYAACLRYVDRQVGRLLDALDALDLADDTVVVLWSDHGWHLGESAQWGKHTPFERALRCPLIVAGPGVPASGAVSRAPVETTDVYPTLLELCGLSDDDPSLATVAPLDGASLVPVLTGTRARLRPGALSCWGRIVSLATADHRLIARRQPDGRLTDVELYALADGEDPLRDLSAGEPALRDALLQQLEARLAER